MSNIDPNQKPRNGKQTYDSLVSRLKRETTDKQTLLDGGVTTKNKTVNMFVAQMNLEIEEHREMLNQLLIPSNKRKFIKHWNENNN